MFAEIIGWILFLPSEFCHVAWEESLTSFSPCELECLPSSLSNATGLFEYSGQGVKNILPQLLYSFAHVVISSPSTLQLCKSSREKAFFPVPNLYFPQFILK